MHTKGACDGVLCRQGETDDAVHSFEEAAAKEPDNTATLAWLAAHHSKQCMWLEAAAHLQAAIEAEPEEVVWKLAVAACVAKGGDATAAMETYEVALRGHPDNVECLRRLISLCDRAGVSLFHVILSVHYLPFPCPPQNIITLLRTSKMRPPR